MSFQSSNLNSVFYQRPETALKSVGIEVREVDLVYELWNILSLKSVSSKYFVSDVPETFLLANNVKLDDRCSRFGRNFIPDLLKNCSECRLKMRTIEQFCRDSEQNFASSKSSAALDGIQSSLGSILLRPMRIVLKKFLEESVNTAQKELTVSQTLEMINRYLIDFKQRLNKTYNFFKEILLYPVSSILEDIPLHLVDGLWNKFLLGLSSSVNPDEEFPLWDVSYVELINLLGQFFNIVCSRRELLSYDRYQPSLSLNDKNMLERNNHQKSSHRDQSCEALPIYFFNLLLTPKLREDLLQSFHFAQKIKQYGNAGMKEKCFQEIFNARVKEMRLKENFQVCGNPFKSLIGLLEQTVETYKLQFMNCIFDGITSNNKLAIALAEIKELFTLRAFASTMADFLDDCNRPRNSNEWLHLLEKDLQVVQNRFRSFANLTRDQADARSKWGLQVHDSKRAWMFSLNCTLEWPLTCIIDADLLSLLEKSFQSLQDLFHSYNMISGLMLKDKLGSVSMSLLSRRKRMLGKNLFESVSVIYAVLRASLESIIDQKSEQLLTCKSLVEMETIVEEWKDEFAKHLDCEKFNRGSYIHAAVEGLSYLIEKFNAAENGFAFDQSLDASMQSSTSLSPISQSNGNLQCANKKSERRVEKWIKAQSRVITVFSAAAEPSTGTFDPSSVSYAIAVLTPKNPGMRR